MELEAVLVGLNSTHLFCFRRPSKPKFAPVRNCWTGPILSVYRVDMFPIRDHNPSNRTPIITYLLIAANILVYLVGLSDQASQNALIRDWALFPSDVANGVAVHTLLTSTFLHAGVLHLGGNMLFLWVFGDNMEDSLGHFRFLLFYLACGIGAGLAHVIVLPFSDIPTVGASGSIAGVLGGYLLLYPKARVDVVFFFLVFFKVIPIPAWITLGGWFALQVFSGTTAASSGGGVAYWAHIGGFVFGLAFTLPYWRRRGRTASGMPSGVPRVKREKPVQDRFSKSDVPTVRRRR
jgi:membrane associated rhomboid family serine protease